MRQGVEIGARAIEGSEGRKQVGLCLGPFGGTLSPGQEYSGVYPPPYGPKSFVKDGENTNLFSRSQARARETQTPSKSASFFDVNPSDISAEEWTSIIALKDFHLNRLEVFAANEDTWKKIDWICFETVPLVREILAIRLAMGQLSQRLTEKYTNSNEDQSWKRPFWISCVFPGGKFPDTSSVEEVVKHLTLTPTSLTSAPELNLGQSELPRPTAIGINCTSPAYISSISQAMTLALTNMQREQNSDSPRDQPPAFVLYPDGGLVYDVLTRTWHAPAPASAAESSSISHSTGAGSWAENVGQVAKEVELATWSNGGAETPVWSHVYVGGCCKASYGEIKGLSKVLKTN